MENSNELTEVALVIDRSGSMHSIKDDMEGGLWALVREQHGLPGSCRVSMYTFDNKFEVNFEGKPSGEITRDDCRIVPRGATALFDAIVMAIAKIEARVLVEPEIERPDKLVIVVITDGQENRSQEIRSLDEVKKAIERVTSKYDWQFAFLAADMAGMAQGRGMAQGVASTSVGSFDKHATRGAVARVSAGVSSYRGGQSKGVDVE